MNNKIIMIGLLLTALNANAQNANNCDSTCFGNSANTMGVQQNITSTQTNNGQVTYVAPPPAPVAATTSASATATRTCGAGYVVDYSMSNYGGCVTNYGVVNNGGYVVDYGMTTLFR